MDFSIFLDHVRHNGNPVPSKEEAFHGHGPYYLENRVELVGNEEADEFGLTPGKSYTVLAYCGPRNTYHTGVLLEGHGDNHWFPFGAFALEHLSVGI